MENGIKQGDIKMPIYLIRSAIPLPMPPGGTLDVEVANIHYESSPDTTLQTMAEPHFARPNTTLLSLECSYNPNIIWYPKYGNDLNFKKISIENYLITLHNTFYQELSLNEFNNKLSTIIASVSPYVIRELELHHDGPSICRCRFDNHEAVINCSTLIGELTDTVFRDLTSIFGTMMLTSKISRAVAPVSVCDPVVNDNQDIEINL